MKKVNLYASAAALFSILLIFGSCEKSSENKTGCNCESTQTAQDQVTVGPDNESTTFSTYDATNGQFVADAGCHADMTLVFRWADNTKAASSSERPPLQYEFQTVFGWFPTNPGMETASVDNSGYHIWTISISEAENKDKPEGTSYGIYVEYGGDMGATNADILCDIKINYKVYSSDAHLNGCK
ncbi:MAG: hypothetical protein DRI88_01645 [Bacteroidetes bacterium]|nr:MAG: hypothetical protein DRI72_07915 [Bacteroidota bacterium]RLD48999.1 MAG: hypothetical protein DRI88_01645 [Bacteroidota bacterium]RLD74315.1 MAG: hypothetical protein DRI87_01430 [Bacteroidota bacterium]RLD84991.1 MAG: hypothetical protein DRJ02_11180 [Bacteroidota bacterium]